MIISVDTEQMNAMAALAQTANAELEQCVNVLLPVTEHNDWNCPERDLINDCIHAIKSDNRNLKESLDSFSAALRQIADRFNAFEAAIPGQYQFIDSLVGSALSVASETSVVPGALPTGIAADVAKMAGGVVGLENYSVGNLTQPIQICDFSNLDVHHFD